MSAAGLGPVPRETKRIFRIHVLALAYPRVPGSHPIHNISSSASPGLDPCDVHIASIHPPADNILSLQHYYNQLQQASLICTYFSSTHPRSPPAEIPPPTILLDNIIITKHVQRLSSSSTSSSLLNYLFTLAFLACAALRNHFRSFPFLCIFIIRGTFPILGISVPSYSLCRPTVYGVPVFLFLLLAPRRVGINRGAVMHSIIHPCMLVVFSPCLTRMMFPETECRGFPLSFLCAYWGRVYILAYQYMDTSSVQGRLAGLGASREVRGWAEPTLKFLDAWAGVQHPN